MKQRTPLQSDEQWLILDTNVIQDLVNRQRQRPLTSVIVEARKKGFAPSISDITTLEILTEAPAQAAALIENYLNTLNIFPVDRKVNKLAARLGYCYKANEDSKKHLSAYSVADRIIAATAITKDAVVLTRDASDFPWPFFQEIQTIDIDYVSKQGNKQLLNLVFKRPNIAAIQQYLLPHENEIAVERKKKNSIKRKTRRSKD